MIESKEFGYYNGYRCLLITLKNKEGYSLTVTNFGASVQAVEAPDKNGIFTDVVLGYDTLEEYANGNSCHGATVGRYANRIGLGRFSLNGEHYELSRNDGENTLHGGFYGYNKRVWEILHAVDAAEPFVEMTYHSPDGEEHFPGAVDITAKYTLISNGYKVEYTAVSDRDTVINLTNHAYFNLKGEGQGNIKDHIVQINSARYTPVDEGLIPTGALKSVALTPYDFNKQKRVGEDMDNGRLPNGYDNNFVLSTEQGKDAAASVYDPDSGRMMVIATNQPAVQFYIGIGLDNEHGKHGHTYCKYGGLCLEPQHFPDSPNHPNFPSTVLHAGEEYYFKTTYMFTAI